VVVVGTDIVFAMIQGVEVESASVVEGNSNSTGPVLPTVSPVLKTSSTNTGAAPGQCLADASVYTLLSVVNLPWSVRTFGCLPPVAMDGSSTPTTAHTRVSPKMTTPMMTTTMMTTTTTMAIMATLKTIVAKMTTMTMTMTTTMTTKTTTILTQAVSSLQVSVPLLLH
jgi:hypothetical protein